MLWKSGAELIGGTCARERRGCREGAGEESEARARVFPEGQRGSAQMRGQGRLCTGCGPRVGWLRGVRREVVPRVWF